MDSDLNIPGRQLEDAFLLFNQISEKLSVSYGDLQAQVAHLSAELAQARSERLVQLAEKEKLARRLEGLLDTLPAAVIVLDERGYITQTNPVAGEMLGNGLHGLCWEKLAHTAFITEDDELRLRDGRWVSVSARPLDGEPGKIILVTDITETHSLQDTVNRQRRLTSLGEMVAGLAHQIRTPLSSALLYLSNLDHPHAGPDDRRRYSAKAKERLLQLDRMVNDMLVFVRGGVSASEYFSAGQLMKQLQQSLEIQFTSGMLSLGIDKQAHAAKIRGNRDALLGAFQNITNNAREAGGDAPSLDIGVYPCESDQIAFSFSDNGCGMPGEIRDRMLEPFFTTKSSGTGLGMAVVNAIVSAHGGQLDISSEPGAGSCITIRLPVAREHGLLPSDITHATRKVGDRSRTHRDRHDKSTGINERKEVEA